MRKQGRIACGAVLVGTIMVGATLAQAQPEKANPAAADKIGQGKPDKPGKAGEPHGKAGEPHGKPGEPHGKAADPHGKSGEPHGKDDEAHGKGPHGKDDNAPGRRHARGALRELLDELKDGKLKKSELKDRLGKLRENEGERRAQHQAEVKARWGAVLAQPAVREELEHHARRMARLNRAAFLAETEITKDKDKLVERIQKLTEKEQARHVRAMERFKSMPPGAAVASAAPAPAAASSKAGEK